VDDKSGIVGRFFSDSKMWLGFGLAVVIQGLNGLNTYFSDVPAVALEIPTGPLFTEAPWNQIGGLTLRVWPIVLGVSYLLTAEISFSLWAFFLFHKAQLVMAYYIGYPAGTLPSPTWARGFSKSFIAYQQFGAYFGYVAIILWTAREHLKWIFRRAFGREKALPGEEREALSYPTAFWGMVLAFVFIVAWTTASGVRGDISVLLWVTYLVLAIGLARVVVEAGLIFVHTGWGPLGLWRTCSGRAGCRLRVRFRLPSLTRP
jgi:hypothetical protein